jgi:hypothetical protein
VAGLANKLCALPAEALAADPIDVELEFLLDGFSPLPALLLLLPDGLAFLLLLPDVAFRPFFLAFACCLGVEVDNEFTPPDKEVTGPSVSIDNNSDGSEILLLLL